ncbi:uncharacterized protein F4812DRAFT_212253 [Daldinia caldariorum]|uniref:uncharacterized protein n=1 Tax=Daldinia caldariorum TaxID=326644 RepID=UPI0020083413|nr:uncharacterized protein F4812DRAFT_212253 [Daldinia caldariorum]KAI1464448.1 hypothetical protein F4812DRAFT_212253 [Daldinia caldariorum]
MPPKHVPDSFRLIEEVFQLTYQNGSYFECTSERVQVSSLDFYSGKPSDNDEQFIRTFPSGQMRQLLEEVRPWDNPDGCPSVLPIDNEVDDAAQARDLWNAFRSHLSINRDGNAPGIIQNTDWKLVVPRDTNLLFRLTRHLPWNVETFFDQCNPAKPHIGCYLANHIPLKETTLCTSEIQTILWTIGCRLMDEKYQNHSIIPVTFLSGTKSSVRIVQGFIDDCRILKVQLTPVIDFSGGERSRWEQFIQMLCWVVGEPVGNTVRML